MQSLFRPEGFPPRPQASPLEVLDAAREVGGPPAALVAKALAVFGPAEARPAAERLYAQLRTGGAAPAWVDELAAAIPGRVVMLRDAYGDGFGLLLDYEHPSDELRSVAVHIDVNLGGIVTEVMQGLPTERAIELAASEPHTETTPIDPAEARARVESAFAELDQTFEPPVGDEVHELRALVEQRFGLLPAGGLAPPAYRELGDGERRELIDAFMASDHGAGLDADAADIAETICDFAGYSDGDPLRWSPAVVAIFLADWVPRKVIADAGWFQSLPLVVRAWARFAGERRGLPAELIDETVQAVDLWMAELEEHIQDPDAWGIGKQIVAAMTDAGIDPEDPEAVETFIAGYNASLPLDDTLDEDALLEAWGRLDASAVDVLRETLAQHRHQPPPAALLATADQVRAGFREQAWPFDYLGALVDISPDELARISDVDLLLAATAALVEPDGIADTEYRIDPEELALANSLDHADWARIVTLAVRSGPGTDLSPQSVAGWMTEDADDADIELIEGALELNAPLWRAIGVIDPADRLTKLGAWLLPRALTREWGGDFDDA
jgi:hypothetical protein